MSGVSAAPEIYQHAIQQSLQGCTGVRNISDYIIVSGKTQQEHDHNFPIVLEDFKSEVLLSTRKNANLVSSKSHFLVITFRQMV